VVVVGQRIFEPALSLSSMTIAIESDVRLNLVVLPFVSGRTRDEITMHRFFGLT
jgi:hypothetical protein